jgi:hypothetical protein
MSELTGELVWLAHVDDAHFVQARRNLLGGYVTMAFGMGRSDVEERAHRDPSGVPSSSVAILRLSGTLR